MFLDAPPRAPRSCMAVPKPLMHHHTITLLIALAGTFAVMAGSAYVHRAHRAELFRAAASPRPCAAVCSLGPVIGTFDGEPIYEWLRVQVFDRQEAPRLITLRFDGVGSGTPQHHFQMQGDQAQLLVGHVLYSSTLTRT